MKSELVEISKFLSFILRHNPEAIGVTLSPQGWVKIDELLEAAKTHGKHLSRRTLDEVVFTNDKQRFAYSPDGLSIRANQGHSLAIDLELKPIKPPHVLYHGTATRYLEAIRREGLLKMQRHHVHLSALQDTAFRVGMRHGKPVVLVIDAQHMAVDGYRFYLSNNGVWLTEHVPPKYLQYE
jgi:putative RNA 2'-phosphotransferase